MIRVLAVQEKNSKNVALLRVQWKKEFLSKLNQEI